MSEMSVCKGTSTISEWGVIVSLSANVANNCVNRVAQIERINFTQS